MPYQFFDLSSSCQSLINGLNQRAWMYQFALNHSEGREKIFAYTGGLFAVASGAIKITMRVFHIAEVIFKGLANFFIGLLAQNPKRLQNSFRQLCILPESIFNLAITPGEIVIDIVVASVKMFRHPLQYMLDQHDAADQDITTVQEDDEAPTLYVFFNSSKDSFSKSHFTEYS